MNLENCFPLLVEDDDSFAMLVVRALRKAGVPEGNVRRYRDGERALAELLVASSVRPSVIILDLDLPGISGLVLLKRIRSWEPLATLPAFILSGRGEGEHVRRAYDLGARTYCVKPLGVHTLQSLIGGILSSLRGEAVFLPGSLPDPR